MGGRVFQGQPPERALQIAIDGGISVALPEIQCAEGHGSSVLHQAAVVFIARGHADIFAPPADHIATGNLTALNQVKARDDTIGMRPEDGAIGFASGHFFDAAGNLVASEFGSRHLTMSVATMMNVPHRICGGGGVEKVEAITRVIRAHLATLLVTDEQTAIAVLEEIS
ncbi:MAG: sugar-binding domain-containing protein [Cypionkella sp.]